VGVGHTLQLEMLDKHWKSWVRMFRVEDQELAEEMAGPYELGKFNWTDVYLAYYLGMNLLKYRSRLG
jgi:hypothetical protein